MIVVHLVDVLLPAMAASAMDIETHREIFDPLWPTIAR
jgi:hypothetical protein